MSVSFTVFVDQHCVSALATFEIEKQLLSFPSSRDLISFRNEFIMLAH